jgi:hypothetical protein
VRDIGQNDRGALPKDTRGQAAQMVEIGHPNGQVLASFGCWLYRIKPA